MLILVLIGALVAAPLSHGQTQTTQIVGSEVKLLPTGETEAPLPPSPLPAGSASAAPLALEKSEPEAPVAANATAESIPESIKDENATLPLVESKPGGQQSLNFSETELEKPKQEQFDLESNATQSSAIELGNENLNASAPLDESKKSEKPDEAKKTEEPKLELESPEIPSENSTHLLVPANETLSEAQNPLAGKNESSSSADLIPELLNSNLNASESESGLNATENNAKFLLPSKIDHLRTTIIGFTGKPVHTFNLSDHQVLYQIKIFWGEPDSWQDIGNPATDRIFELFCWLNTNGGFGRDLVRANLSSSLISHSQWFAFPEAEDEQIKNISVNCGIRPLNAAGKSGDWTFSDPASVREAPIFLRGFENVNVKGWTKEEVVRLIKNQKRLDNPQPSSADKKAAAAKSRAKNRKAS